MPTHLTIEPTKPYKSSRLAIPPSPFSPLTPLTRQNSPPPRKATLDNDPFKPQAALQLPSPPDAPLHWLWQCHLCSRVYQLGVTRRCLDDGHLFCAGTTTVKRSRRTGGKKVVRHKACASEFDYQGWKVWGEWRRDVGERRAGARQLEEALRGDGVVLPLFAPEVPGEGEWLRGWWSKKVSKEGMVGGDYWGKKDCWNTCDYPSECRWGKQYGVQTPVAVVPSTPPHEHATTESETAEHLETINEAKTSFDDILLDLPTDPSISDPSSESYLSPLSLSPKSNNKSSSSTISSTTPLEQNTSKPNMDDLLQSAKRRKRRSAGAPPSPLASNPPSPTTAVLAPGVASSSASASATRLQKAFDDFDLDIKESWGGLSEKVKRRLLDGGGIW